MVHLIRYLSQVNYSLIRAYDIITLQRPKQGLLAAFDCFTQKHHIKHAPVANLGMLS